MVASLSTGLSLISKDISAGQPHLVFSSLKRTPWAAIITYHAVKCCFHIGHVTLDRFHAHQLAHVTLMRKLKMFSENDLLAVNTHHDAGPTWSGSRGHLSRIDYVGVTSKLVKQISCCNVWHNIDLAPAA